MRIQIGQRPAHDFSNPIGLLGDCHRRIEQFLAVLQLIATRSTDGVLVPEHRRELESALTYFSTAAPRHTADEESSVFPRLRASGDPAASAAIALLDRLEHDHAEADGLHGAVDAIGRRWLATGSLPPDDLAQLRRSLERLDAIYREHIAVEDRELFPAAARLLSEEELRAVGLEMAERRAIRTFTP